MERISEFRWIGRVAMLILLAVAIQGPWVYTLDGVPPAEYCQAPNYLLDNDRCAGTVTGAEWLSHMAGFFWIAVSYFGPEPIPLLERLRLIPFFLAWLLIILPLFSTLLLLWSERRWRMHLAHLVICALSAGLCGLLISVEPGLLSGRFWGLWLYIGIIVISAVVEAPAMRAAKRVGASGAPAGDVAGGLTA